MRNVIPTSMLLAILAACNVSAAELPVLVGDGVVVEEAWATIDSGGRSEVFLVISNQNGEGTLPLRVTVSDAATSRIVSPGGDLDALAIPPHSELYMQPDGIRIEAAGLYGESMVPVSVSLGQAGPVAITVKVLAPGEAPPDHHDYAHG